MASLDEFVRLLHQADEAGEPKRRRTVRGGARDVPFGHVDMKKLEHCARTLQKQVRIIVKEAPGADELRALVESPRVDDDVRHEIERNPLVQLAGRLKSRYVAGGLPIFDEILGGAVAGAAGGGETGEGTGPPGAAAVAAASDSDSESDAMADAADAADAAEAADAAGVAGAASAAGAAGLPPLPPIHNPHLLDRVFIHKSTLNDRTYLSEHELIASHNERLEFLGDSILNNVVTMIIYERYDHSPEGDLSKIRSQLVNNKTLAEFAMAYGLNARLRSNISDSVLRQGNQKIYADVFEAYIGALATEHGMELGVIKRWLSQILRAKLKEFDVEINGVEPVNKNAKTDLYSLIGSAAFHPRYRVVRMGDGASKAFKIRCEMGEDVLGEGVAPSSKEAGLRAAMQALKNRPLLEKYGQMRLGTDRSESRVTRAEGAPQGVPSAEPEGAAATASESDRDPGASASASASGSSATGLPLSDSGAFLPDAKNDLYAILNKLGITPRYRVTPHDTLFRGELYIGSELVAVGVDVSKKRAATRAAMALLKDKEALQAVERMG
ncbi:ribonuclease III [[Candida] zeylanoides]